ncbi:hypothetical protein RUM44_005758 [Polyplax serrata]|uniref:Uncharacterized protein n=1 Tax=Polyplax serrata TaxID=468196 RepID=A0ABR1AW30_POLSC
MSLSMDSGSQFFVPLRAQLDYGRRAINFPYYFFFQPLYQQDTEPSSHVSLNARSETFVTSPAQIPEIGEGLLPGCEIDKGIYLSKAMVINDQNQVIATILNTRSQDSTISIAPSVLEPIPHNSNPLPIQVLVPFNRGRRLCSNP